ncbi:cupredoxin domain-containing protein [Arthrobacter sp. H14]|uniref:cupredoxin domain-containing protein n=1 Tax=Arthrobacter sp. H14 TaxID=1312959 RepID=UPI0004B2885B|nr:cupredoxin domain-containing protein [Arthrobacter sp. H14]
MNTSKKALSIAFAATLAGGATLGTASIATASGPAVNTSAMVSAMTQAAEVTITIDDFAYKVSGPVTAGATVTVINNDDVPHTATDADGSFDTGIIDAGATGSFTAPQEPGKYTLICTIHPNMSGMLTVEAAGSSMGDNSMDDGGSSAGGTGSSEDGATGMEQQVSPMPEGGADTGVTEQGNASNLGVVALGGGLVLAVAAGGTYVVRRNASDRT